jgi:hypothetical protein
VNKTDIGFYITIISALITLIGFAVTIVQIIKTRKISDARNDLAVAEAEPPTGGEA